MKLGLKLCAVDIDFKSAVADFMSKLDSDEKRINEWKIDQKTISILNPRARRVTKMENKKACET